MTVLVGFGLGPNGPSFGRLENDFLKIRFLRLWTEGQRLPPRWLPGTGCAMPVPLGTINLSMI